MDFGKPVTLGRAELAFFADGSRFAAPRTIVVEAWRGGRWSKVASGTVPLANGITQVAWPAVESDRIRVVMTPSTGRAIRLAELKAFAH